MKRDDLRADEVFKSMQDKSSYVIITPAYNEARYIKATIESVIAQTTKPLMWVIVDDGSTDETAHIINGYAQQHNWIRYVHRTKVAGQSYFGSNVHAIMTGYKQIDDFAPDYIAILDADMELPGNYYEQIIKRMECDRKIGVASGVYVDRINHDTFRNIMNDRRSTPKSLMVFRKLCFQQIGGFVPIKYGGEDVCACFMARMKGWKTWSFPDIIGIHNKPVGYGHAKGLLKIRFRQGICEFFLATHPLFFMLKSLRRCIKERPFLTGGFARILGYTWAFLMPEKRQIPKELVRYIRGEHLQRLISRNKIPAEHQVSVVRKNTLL